MKINLKKELKQSLIIGSLFLLMFLTGLHVEVFGFMQRGILATRIIVPDVETQASPEQSPADLNISLINSKGEEINMQDFKGKAIFFNIWATWCAPCVAEMPGINALYNEVKDENVVFVMLSTDEVFEKAIKFKETKNFDFEVYRLKGKLPSQFHTQSIPTTFVIDKDGNIAMTHKGMANYNTNEFKKHLRSWM